MLWLVRLHSHLADQADRMWCGKLVLIAVSFVAYNFFFTLDVAAIILAGFLAHEYGHASGHWWYGGTIRGVYIYPWFGAMCRWGSSFTSARDELLSVIMGPICSRGLGVGMWIGYRISGDPLWWFCSLGFAFQDLRNLLPFSRYLDGGRIVRILMASRSAPSCLTGREQVGYALMYSVLLLLCVVPLVDTGLNFRWGHVEMFLRPWLSAGIRFWVSLLRWW